MGNPHLAGSLFDSAGVAVAGATVNIYAAGDTATPLATTTTAASGAWSIANSSTGSPDVEIDAGGEISRFKFSDRVALTGMDAQTYKWRTSSGTSSFDLEVLPPSAGFSQDITVRFPDMTDTAGTIMVEGSSGSSFFVGPATIGAATFTPKTLNGAGVTDSLAALTTDTGLSFAAVTGLNYKIEGALHFDMGSSVADPVAKFSGVSGNLVVDGTAWWMDGGLSASDSARAFQFTEASSVSMSVTNTGIYTMNFNATVTANINDTFTIQMRQGTANASATQLLSKSWMTAQRIS